MAQDWADKIAQKLISQASMQEGICLILGAADTGKTTLAEAITKRAVSSRPVAIIDADIGQSHIGPPTTVGWAIVDKPEIGFSQLTASGISFVGDVTPVGHLLQLTAAIAQCARHASEAAELIIIDTPGLVSGGAATALWWTVQRTLQPESILAVRRSDELTGILSGLCSLDLKLELIESPAQIPTKSPEKRRGYRQKQFERYFRDSCPYNIRLSDIAIQSGWNLNRNDFAHRLVALRDAKGMDLAVGVVADWQADKDMAVVRAPHLDVNQIRCLVIGDMTLEIPSE
jgi:polynucleotide 5'-hydroxyl-kinase GRC3/NOL9